MCYGCVMCCFAKKNLYDGLSQEEQLEQEGKDAGASPDATKADALMLCACCHSWSLRKYDTASSTASGGRGCKHFKQASTKGQELSNASKLAKMGPPARASAASRSTAL